MLWIVGYCSEEKAWSVGGSTEDYPSPQWTVYEVEAPDSNAAKTEARRIRKNEQDKARRLEHKKLYADMDKRRTAILLRQARGIGISDLEKMPPWFLTKLWFEWKEKDSAR